MTTYTILAIDDDQGARTLLEIMLSRSGFSVILADDADDALEKLNEGLPHLIISDISLPGMNGIEFVQTLRQRPDTVHIPIIILSAHHDDKTINEAMAAGATEFVKKPLMMGELKERLLRLIEGNA